MYRRRFPYVVFTIPVICFVFQLLAGCRKSAAVQTTVVTGELRDASTGTLIPNASIQLVQYVKNPYLDTGAVQLVTKTDANGHFRFAFEGSGLTGWYVRAEPNDSIRYEIPRRVSIGASEHVTLTALQGIPARLHLIVRQNRSDMLLLNFKPAPGGPIDTTIRIWGFREPALLYRVAVNDEAKRILRGRAIPLKFVPGNDQPIVVDIPDMMQLPELY
ncbi:carboxypeptidase-like regulatory domain-containing protein [Chitinophaga caseinilytica]|uniref:Carboxypeptidase-like regulatory domain-containing protein n=1 Tax=Chitinophaga caseinilytica TaxID=2267521 RepID=A0ABZ2Z3Q0_9BACT